MERAEETRVPASVDGDRLWTDLQTLRGFSSTEVGVTRPSWSDHYLAARDWLSEQCEAAGLKVIVDPVGNLWATWEVGTGPAVVVGSHIDSAPQGGHLDGCLGVLGGLEAIRTLRAAGVEPLRPVRLVAWIEEEGAATGRTLLGSGVFTGAVSLEQLADRVGPLGIPLSGLLERDHRRARDWNDPGVPTLRDVACYLELHVEQGPVLDVEQVAIGVVVGLVGYRSGSLRLNGVSNHAGTTPMHMRHDAVVAAAEAVLAVRDLAVCQGVTATTGRLVVQPNGANVIPSSVEMSLDARHHEAPVLDAYIKSVIEEVVEIGRREGVRTDVEERARVSPVRFDDAIRLEIDAAASRRGLSSRALASGALHDAGNLARHCPTGMIFVPSAGGVSHAPEEHTSKQACVAGVNVLADVIRALSTGSMQRRSPA